MRPSTSDAASTPTSTPTPTLTSGPLTKMHADEVDTSPTIVRELLTEQFPQWASLPITPVPSSGTDNAMFRLGDDLAVRMPRIGWAVEHVAKEQEWLPRLAPHLPLAIPRPAAHGAPGADYPYPWSVIHWLPGEPALPERLNNLPQAATSLARFLGALQAIDTTGAPGPGSHNFGRGASLSTRDESVRRNIDTCHALGMVDRDAALAVWEAAVTVGDWDAPGVWFHGDLLPSNLLAINGELSAVIDFGCMGVGDPAYDLLPAWLTYNTPDARAAFRAALPPAVAADATWARGRGLSLAFAVGAISFYIVTNPTLADIGRCALAAVFEDVGAGTGAGKGATTTAAASASAGG